jgi:hypothetical protein
VFRAERLPFNLEARFLPHPGIFDASENLQGERNFMPKENSVKLRQEKKRSYHNEQSKKYRKRSPETKS